MLTPEIQKWNSRIAQAQIERQLLISASILPHMENCIFSEPVNIGTEENPFWAYSKLGCETESETLIQDENETKFWLDKRVNYGDLVIITFLIVFGLALIYKFVWDYFFKEWKSKP